MGGGGTSYPTGVVSAGATTKDPTTITARKHARARVQNCDPSCVGCEMSLFVCLAITGRLKTRNRSNAEYP